jgi:hypothetical protein
VLIRAFFTTNSRAANAHMVKSADCSKASGIDQQILGMDFPVDIPTLGQIFRTHKERKQMRTSQIAGKRRLTIEKMA